MVMDFCCNCKNVEQMNVYYETIDGGLCPINDFFIGYCHKIGGYVKATDCCSSCETLF